MKPILMLTSESSDYAYSVLKIHRSKPLWILEPIGRQATDLNNTVPGDLGQQPASA